MHKPPRATALQARQTLSRLGTVRPILLLLISAALCLAQLQGIVDVHVHSDPDAVPRKLDALDTARLAKEAGFRAIVLKNHWTSTAQLAYTVAKVVPGIEVLGESRSTARWAE
jgi:hypothetical protein